MGELHPCSSGSQPVAFCHTSHSWQGDTSGKVINTEDVQQVGYQRTKNYTGWTKGPQQTEDLLDDDVKGDESIGKGVQVSFR